MPESDDRQDPGRKARRRTLLFVVLATALLTLTVAIYTLVDRPVTNRLTPGGVNYNPGQPGSTTGDSVEH